MRILVTGGAGFVGTNLIKRLLKDGHNVVSLDNYSTGKKENEQEGCTYYDCDIRDVVDFSYFMEKPDVIYHLGALARIQPSFQNPANTLEVGILGTMNILEWVRPVHEHIEGAKTYSHLPPHDELSLLHEKDISKQEFQNRLYDSIL